MEQQQPSAEIRKNNCSTESSSNPNLNKTFSNSSGTECGQPLRAQEIIIDFTPRDDVDTEAVRRKYCDILKLLESNPDVQALKVLPEKETCSQAAKPSIAENASSVTLPSLPCDTALSMLELVENKGLIKPVFGAKLPQSDCSLGSREYRENELPPIRPNKSSQGKKKRSAGERKKPALSPPGLLNSMCKELEEWDDAHPKSFEPPRHQPPLSPCMMQKKTSF